MPEVQDARALGVLPEGMLERELDNGLTVLVIQVPTPGLVSLQTWVHAGSAKEVLPGTTGFAHFFEHLMFHGTPTWPSSQREQRLLELGAEENAWTSQDVTCYHLQAPVDSLAELLAIEADRFANLQLTADGVESEAGAVLGEYRTGVNDPVWALDEAMWKTAFDVHPYRHPVIGWEADILAMADGLEAVENFRATWIAPQHLTIVVAGDVDPVATADDVAAAFGDWAPPTVSTPEVPEEPAQQALRRHHVQWDRGSTNPWLAVGWRVPGHQPGAVDSTALVVAKELVGARVRPLYRELVEEEQLVWDLEVPSWPVQEPGLFLVSVELKDRADAERVEARVTQAVQELREVSEADVRSAADQVRRATILCLGSPEDWAFAVGEAAVFSGHARGLDAHLTSLTEVSAADVHRVSEAFLVDTGRTVVTLWNAEEAP